MSDEAKELVDLVEELNLRSKTLTGMTQLLNLVGTYMNDETNSPQEDQDEMAVNDFIAHLVGDHPENAGHILLALASLIVQTSNWEDVQEWLTFQENAIKQMAEEAGLHGHAHDN